MARLRAEMPVAGRCGGGNEHRRASHLECPLRSGALACLCLLREGFQEVPPGILKLTDLNACLVSQGHLSSGYLVIPCTEVIEISMATAN